MLQKKFLFYLSLLVLILILAIFGFYLFQKKLKPAKELKIQPTEIIMELRLTSPFFENQGQIPVKYTCDGQDINPPLKIEGVTEEVKSLALIVDDLDAPIGTFTHWLFWNVSPAKKEIEENSLPAGAIQGKNDFGKIGYGGPCPPRGPSHRYFFKLFALDSQLDLEKGASKKELEKAMTGHILDQTSLVGLYQR